MLEFIMTSSSVTFGWRHSNLLFADYYPKSLSESVDRVIFVRGSGSFFGLCYFSKATRIKQPHLITSPVLRWCVWHLWVGWFLFISVRSTVYQPLSSTLAAVQRKLQLFHWPWWCVIHHLSPPTHSTYTADGLKWHTSWAVLFLLFIIALSLYLSYPRHGISIGSQVIAFDMPTHLQS